MRRIRRKARIVVESLVSGMSTSPYNSVDVIGLKGPCKVVTNANLFLQSRNPPNTLVHSLLVPSLSSPMLTCSEAEEQWCATAISKQRVV